MVSTTDWDAKSDIKQHTFHYFVKGLRTLWALVAAEQGRVAHAAALLGFTELCGLIAALVSKKIFDDLPLIQTTGIRSLQLFVLLMFIIGCIQVCIRRFAQEPLFCTAIINLENQWPMMAMRKLLALSMEYHEKENTGKKISKVAKGVEKLANTLADMFWQLLPKLAPVLNIITIIIIDWRLGLTLFLPLVVAARIYLKSHEKFYDVWVAYEEKKEEAMGIFCQAIISIRTTQSTVAEEREAKRHDAIREYMRTIDNVAIGELQKYFCGMEMIIEFAVALTMALGVALLAEGSVTVGTLVFVYVTGKFCAQSIWGIMQVYTRTFRNLIVGERMQELLGEEVTVANEAPGVIPVITTGTVVLKNVSHVYPNKEKAAVHNVDLTIPSGEMLAFVGKSGSGKSTLVNLITRVYDRTGGSLTIDSTDVRTVDRDWYRKRFAYVPQDVEIFEGTIKYNVAYAYPDASDEWITQAVSAACLEEAVTDIARFPNKLETLVGERGVRLSGGEKQRVGIARAYISLLAGASVLVLDEATSSLDAESERVVQGFIEQLRQQRSITIIAVAHRLATIQKADRICVIESGIITEKGNHARLVEKNGLYNRLVKLQQLGELRT